MSRGQLLSRDLPESVSCYRLKNGLQVYFKHKYPYNLYSDSFPTIPNRFPPEVSVKFAGELDDSLHFYTEQSSCDEEDIIKTYTFYKLCCAVNTYSDFRFETLDVLSIRKEIQFATQQPYFLEFSEQEVCLKSFDKQTALRLNKANSSILNDARSFSFFLWNDSAIFVKRNLDGKGTDISSEEAQLRVIAVQHDLPTPNSVYANDNLLYMLCGCVLFVFKEDFEYSTFRINHQYCHIGGVQDRVVFLNAPCLFYTQALFEEYQQLNEELGNLKILEDVPPTLDEVRRMEDEIRRLRKEKLELQLSRSNGIFDENYTVSGTLGRGASGVVFEATNKVDKGVYAVKQIAIEPRNLSGALEEVRAMCKLHHPSIVRYYISWIEQPPGFNRVHIYIPMERCNYSLAQWLEQNQKSESRAPNRMNSWFKQMVSGVKYMHSKNLIHRDLKPGNILFADDDTLKIADMGIVIERKMCDGREVAVTHNGLGTPYYMIPEQRWFDIRSSSDVFTLGLIFAEMRVVMDDYTKTEIFNSYRVDPTTLIVEALRPAQRFATMFGQETSLFISTLSTYDPTLRPTCQEVLELLAKLEIRKTH